MPRLAADSDSSLRSAAGRPPSVLLTKHSLPSRLHWEPDGAQKRAKAHIPGLFRVHARFSFIVSGFPTCAQRGARRPAYNQQTPQRHINCGRAVSARENPPYQRRCQLHTHHGADARLP